MAFSQRARAYTLNPTLPCPTLPLSPRALSDSSIIPAAGRLCLKLPAQYAKYVLQLTTFSTPRKASAGAGSPLDTIVSSADFVLHTSRARLNNTLARNFSASDGVRPPCR